MNTLLTVAVIVPLLNEREALPEIVPALLGSKADELILVDGGSVDGSWEWLQGYAKQNVGPVTLLQTQAGRARQMNAGAQQASAEVLLFLHADTHLPENFLEEVKKEQWGRFDVCFSDNDQPKSLSLSLVQRMMNLRSRISGIATGDQAIFVRRHLFKKVGGYDDIPIMEDVSLSKKLRRVSKPYCSTSLVATSARRWKKYGVWKTIGLMWRLRWSYFFGANPHELAQKYKQVR